jgi:hypothetical protein
MPAYFLQGNLLRFELLNRNLKFTYKMRASHRGGKRFRGTEESLAGGASVAFLSTGRDENILWKAHAAFFLQCFKA